MTRSLSEINYDLIHVAAPRRYDSTCICKVKYDSGKFDITFDNAKIIHVKHPDTHDMYVHIKLGRETVKHILKLEKAFVNIVANNTDNWFKNKMKSCAVDEHFGSNISLDENNVPTFKCRLEEPNQDIAVVGVGEKVQLKMRISCLRFTKKLFGLGWSVISVDPVKECASKDYLFTSDEETEDDFSDEDASSMGEEDLGPDDDEILSILDEIVGKSIQTRNELKASLESLEHAIATVKECPSIKNINALHEIYIQIVPDDGKNQ
jgi:hypothetical protein